MSLSDPRWLTAVIESAEDAILTHTLPGVVVSWNAGATRLFGHTAQEMIGAPVARLVPPERLAEQAELVGRVGRGERIEHVETVRRHRDGRAVDVCLTLSPVWDGGVVVGVAVIARDLATRRQAGRLLGDQQRWLEGTLASLAEAVVALDPDGRIRFMNEAAARLTGWAPAEAAGRPVEAVLWLVEERTRRRRSLDRGADPAAPGPERALVLARDGTEWPVEVRVRAIEAGDQGLLGTVVVLHDLSALRRAREAQHRLAAIIESSDDAIISKDLDGTVLSWNPAAERLFGYTAQEMVGHPMTTIVPRDRLAEEAEFLRRVSRGERIDHYETVRVRKDGRRVEVSVTLSPVLEEHGRVVAVSSIARDITDRIRIERERAMLLERERAALQASLAAHRSKDEFLATVSHELRTPINSILGWATLLQGGRLPAEDQARALDVIARNARLQADLISQLLDLSSVVLGKVRLEVRPLDLRTVVQSAIDSIRPSLAVKTLDLQATLPPEPCPVLGDPARLQQIFWNLLTNALKFTPAGGGIRVSVARRETTVAVEVSDTGVGIDPAVLPVVFDRFRQADGSATRRHGGLGLGLAIVRQLVELHGGSVVAESAGIGAGARFTVEIPVLQGQRHGIPAVLNGPATPGGDVALHGRRVLVVEDDPDSRALIEYVLKGAGASVHPAGSAQAALELWARDRFDVLVSDLAMPEMDGYALLRVIREGSRGTPVPAIALTAFAREEDRARAREVGYQGHLAKPVDPDELLRTVAAVTRDCSPAKEAEPGDPVQS